MTAREMFNPAGDPVEVTGEINRYDAVVAALLALATGALLWLWPFPGLHPSVWADAAVAAGVRPAAHVGSGYAVALATFAYRYLGIGGGNAFLQIAGRLVLAVVAAVFYLALREMLAIVMKSRPQRSRRRTFVMQVASAVGAVAFVCADPVWRAGQCLSETTLLLALTVLATGTFFVFIRRGSLPYAYVCTFLLGVLTADTPFGLVMLGVFALANDLALRFLPSENSPFVKPAVIAVAKWYMTFLFLFGAFLGIAANILSFVHHQGLMASGGGFGSVPLAYLLDYWARVTGCADIVGAVVLVGVCAAPFLVSVVCFPIAADEDRFLSYGMGLVFLVCGVVAFAQMSLQSALWFWTYCPVASDFLLAVGLLLVSGTLAMSVMTLGVDALCRNHVLLAWQLYGRDDDAQAENAVAARSSAGFVRKSFMFLLPTLALLAIVPGRLQRATRDMLKIAGDAVSELVTEAGDAACVFSDGHFDDAIELESARRGRPLACYSLFGGAGGRDAYLRTRGIADTEDLYAFRFDAGMGLRTWIHDKPKSLERAAVMMGFDLWKRDGKAIPPVGGLLSRPAGGDEKARREGVVRARALADRVLGVHARGDYSHCTDAGVRSAFNAVEWRLARACVYRGERADLAGDAKGAMAEVTLAKELNDRNEVYRDLVKTMEKRGAQLLQQLTPREGLQLALVRADFTTGHVYAETILGSDPENPDANFAMGMYYLKKGQLTRAESFLKRCLVRSPNEPAVYNNLAMIELSLGKLKAAKANAEKALKLVPESAAVRDTLKAVEAAIAGNSSPTNAPAARAARD